MTEISEKAESQSDKFKRAACDLECDPDEARWEDKLRKVVKPKPLPEKLRSRDGCCSRGRADVPKTMPTH
jgi:hypothetical protein